MIIDCISDTHGIINLAKLNWSDDADMLIVAGDITRSSNDSQLTFINMIKDIAALPHPKKIVVAGNHDKIFFEQRLNWEDYGITYLENEVIEYEGLKIAGSPMTPEFCGWWFMDTEDNLFKMWDNMMTDDIDILVTHGPPHGILDNFDDQHCGSTSLKKIVDKYKPRYSISGHIHESHGQIKVGDTQYYNVSLLDGDYRHVNDITRIEVSERD